MTELDQVPLLLDVATPTDASDPFVESLIELAQRNLDRAGAASASMVLTAAGGWCAPHPPEGSAPAQAHEILRPSVAEEAPAPTEMLACGCSVDVLETGTHLPGCAVLNIPSEVSDPEEVNATRAGGGP